MDNTYKHMTENKTKLPAVVKVLLVTTFTTSLIVGFGEYLFWTKPLQDEAKQNKKEIATLTEQIKALTKSTSPKDLQTYSNSEFGFLFQYSSDYAIADAPDGRDVPAGAFSFLYKKSDTSKTAIIWIAIRNSKDAVIPETEHTDKVVKSETAVGVDKVRATSLNLLPGRGDEFAASLHILHIIIPLVKDPARSLVLTNIGDVDLATFQSVLVTLEIGK